MQSNVRMSQKTTKNWNSSQADLGQSVLRGYKRRVKGSNGRGAHHVCMPTAQLSRPRGSTQTLPPRHNEAQRHRRDCHAVIKACGIAHIPGVDPREGRIRLPSEKGHTWDKRMNEMPPMKRQCQEVAEKQDGERQLPGSKEQLPITLLPIRVTNIHSPPCETSARGALSHEPLQWTIDATVG